MQDNAKSLGAVWSALPFKGTFLGLLAAWLALFHFLGNSVFGYVDTPSLFTWLWSNWKGNADDQIGMLVPPLVLVLLHMRREQLVGLPVRPWAPALGLLLLALLLHIVGYTVQQTRISAFAFFTGLYGLMGLIWGPALLRAAFFPYFLLAFCIPASVFLEPLTFPLRLLVTKIAVLVCNGPLAMKVKIDGTLIFNQARTFQFDVAPACSGIHSVTAMLLLTLTYGFLNFVAGWRRAVLLLAAIPIAVVCNIIRLIVVVMIGEMDASKAVQIETKFGFVTFLLGLGCVVLLGRLLRERRVDAAAPTPEVE